MSTNIPLPALDVQTPQQQNPIDQYGKLVQLRSLLQQEQQRQQMAPLQQQQAQQNVQSSALQNQLQQQQIKDSQIFMQSLQKNKGDFDAALDDAAQNGMSGPGYIQMGQMVLQRKAQLMKLTGDQLDNEAKSNDKLGGILDGYKALPPDQQAAQWPTIRQQVAQSAPQLANVLPFSPPQQSQVDSFEAMLMGQKNLIAKQTANARQTTADTEASKLAGEQNPQSPLYAPSAASLALGTAPGAAQIQSGEAAQAGKVAGAQAAAKQPYEMQLANVRAQVEQQLQTNKDARDKIETNVLKPYQDKMSAIGELQSAVQQAEGGNITAARAVALKLIGVSNPDGTKRYNETEAQRLISQGNIPQRLQGTVQNLLTGNNWTPQMSKDMLSFGDAQGQVAQQNLNRGIDATNMLYNTNVGGGLKQQSTQSKGTGKDLGAAPAGAREGGTGKFNGVPAKIVNGRVVAQ